MSNVFSFKTNFNPRLKLDGLIVRKVQKLETALSAEIREIRRKTQAGIDVNNEPFAPYTEAYRNWKNGLTASGQNRRRKKGRLVRDARAKDGKPGRGDIVNLTLSGEMLRSMFSKVETVGTTITGTITFLSDMADRARGNLKKRNFFGWSEEAKQRLLNKLK